MTIEMKRKPGVCCPEPTCDNREVKACESCGRSCAGCVRDYYIAKEQGRVRYE